MNKTLAILLTTFCALHLQAQEVVDFSADGVIGDAKPVVPVGVGTVDVADSLTSATTTAFRPFLPSLTRRGTIAHYPFYGGFHTGWNDWSLHTGLNVSLSASAFFGLGHHGGSGFSNTVSLMYADTLTTRLSYAVGGYYSRLDWRGMNVGDAGLSAMLDYRFDDHWEGTFFVQKTFVQPKTPMPLFLREDIGDKIGAEVRYHFNPAFSVGVSVWSGSRQYFQP